MVYFQLKQQSSTYEEPNFMRIAGILVKLGSDPKIVDWPSSPDLLLFLEETKPAILIYEAGEILNRVEEVIFNIIYFSNSWCYSHTGYLTFRMGSSAKTRVKDDTI